MVANFVIFVIIGSFLLAAIYSSSTYFVFAAETECKSTSKRTATCQVTEDNGDFTRWVCEKNPDGKTWQCAELKQAITGASIPTELQDALDIAVQESQNTTKVPKAGILNQPDDLSDDESTENGDDIEDPNDGFNDDEPTINPGQ
ncbi:MAG TPA: hypothetical protein VJ772_06430 [Nitrososphaeraceae archaeon]|nr:hypothetical protein [Nitrososphaeraceae archaeon]